MTKSERRRRFEALFASYSPDIVAYCGWRAASVSDAQDAVAEVLLTAWRRLDELPEGDAARVWLYATARRVIANQQRSNRRRAALVERLALDVTWVTREPPSSGREEIMVHEALGRLGPRDHRAGAAAPCPASLPRRLRGPARPRRQRTRGARGLGGGDEVGLLRRAAAMRPRTTRKVWR
jgi:RNA polymerase sigma factor (sigma-70 family)